MIHLTYALFAGLIIGTMIYFLFKGNSPRIMRNFPIVYKGNTYWISRAVAVTNIIFAQDGLDNWYVLGSKRGDGTPDFQGYWNCVCGYLDFNETAIEAVVRETFEEVGINIKAPYSVLSNISFMNFSTSPNENKQNVSLRYITILDKRIENYPLSSENSEPNEVSEIKWIPIKDIDKYTWAFNHDKLINEAIANKHLN